VYQLGFGIIFVGSVIQLFLKSTWDGIGLLILLIGYVEDILYYLLIPFVNSIILIMTGYVYKQDGIFPSHISGWVGWVSRRFESNFSLPLDAVLLLNLSVILLLVAVMRARK
jgi:hypothetical protein